MHLLELGTYYTEYEFDQSVTVLTVCKRKKSSETVQYIIFLDSDLQTLDIYNGPSQVYYIKPDGRIHLYTKGLIK